MRLDLIVIGVLVVFAIFMALVLFAVFGGRRSGPQARLNAPGPDATHHRVDRDGGSSGGGGISE